jgi:hypothetical protein
LTPSSILRGRAVLVLPVLVAALALSACGSSSSSSSSAAGGGTSVSTSSNRQQARVALAKCLRAQGLNVPDPGAGGAPGGGGGGIFRSLQNIPTAQLTAARQACKSEFSAAFPQANLSPAQRAQLQQQLVKFASCMRSHGINFPDPQVGTGGGPGFGRAFRNVDRNSPAFASAAQACRSLRPRFGGRGGPGGPGA